MNKIRDVIVIIVIIWAVYALDFLLPFDLNQLGILPRTLNGLRGIVLSPFLHGNIMHITSNTVPFLILGSMLYLFYPRRALQVIVFSILLSGSLVWIFARQDIHIGLSGVIYALAAFLVFAGIFSRKFARIVLAILVIVFYGGMVWGVLPTNPHISWEGHLTGAFTGVWLANIYYRKIKREGD